MPKTGSRETAAGGRRRRTTHTIAAVVVLAMGCADDGPSGPVTPPDGLAEQVRQDALARGLRPMVPARAVRPALVELGRMLVFDKELSGARDISCMSCHLPSFGTSDGLPLSIGQGATGLGPGRSHPGGVFIARNAPPFFNLHALDTFFWDGRLERTGLGRPRIPLGDAVTPSMRQAFEFGPLSALGLFPVLDRDEMRGHGGNDLAAVPDDDPGRAWAAIMDRLGAIPEYRAMFEAAYPGTRFDEMSFSHGSNAMAGFLVDRLRSENTPWDRFLAGDDAALTSGALEGARVFLGPGRCATCHNGALLSDQQFHNTGLVQLGPGKGHGIGGRDDLGRGGVLGESSIRAFRTPPLRNVELTGPWGHAGQFDDLADFVAHYDDARGALFEYSGRGLPAALAGTMLDNRHEIAGTISPLVEGIRLGEPEVAGLVAFLRALTDDRALDLDPLAPPGVPSGLPIDR